MWIILVFEWDYYLGRRDGVTSERIESAQRTDQVFYQLDDVSTEASEVPQTSVPADRVYIREISGWRESEGICMGVNSCCLFICLFVERASWCVECPGNDDWWEERLSQVPTTGNLWSCQLLGTRVHKVGSCIRDLRTENGRKLIFQ